MAAHPKLRIIWKEAVRFRPGVIIFLLKIILMEIEMEAILDENFCCKVNLERNGMFENLILIVNSCIQKKKEHF